MAERRFLTDLPEESALRRQSTVSAITFSIVAHATILVILAFLGLRTAIVDRTQQPPSVAARLVYSHEAGGSSGPKGGEKTPAPPRMAQIVGRRPIVAPAVRPALQPDTTPRPIVQEPLPSIPTTAGIVDVGVREVIGTLAAVRTDGAGPGDQSGPGNGRGGPGCCGGNGNRDGAGEGTDGVEPGNGVSWPRLVREVKPNYTADAMRAQIEGLVELDIVVMPDGSVGSVRIKRSLDSRFGLDAEAIKAVRLWRFDPSRRAGKAVASRVGVELSFTLR